SIPHSRNVVVPILIVSPSAIVTVWALAGRAKRSRTSAVRVISNRSLERALGILAHVVDHLAVVGQALRRHALDLAAHLAHRADGALQRLLEVAGRRGSFDLECHDVG